VIDPLIPSIVEMQRSIYHAQAVDKAIVDTINWSMAEAEQYLIENGIDPVLAKTTAQQIMEKQLYDMQSSLGGWTG
jgi:hypothetical protein